jgi:hypothetical protein
MTRNRQNNIDALLSRRVATLRAHAERLQSKAARNLPADQHAEQMRQIDDAWAKHAEAVKELEQSRTVYLLEPAVNEAAELRRARAVVATELGDLSRSSTQEAVLLLHDVRSRQLDGYSQPVRETLNAELWEQTNQILLADPQAEWDQTQWTQGSDELRDMYAGRSPLIDSVGIRRADVAEPEVTPERLERGADALAAEGQHDTPERAARRAQVVADLRARAAALRSTQLAQPHVQAQDHPALGAYRTAEEHERRRTESQRHHPNTRDRGPGGR